MNWRSATPWRSAVTWRGATVLSLRVADTYADVREDAYQDRYGKLVSGGSVSGGSGRLTLVSASVLSLTASAGGSASGGTAQLRLVARLLAGAGGSQSAGTGVLQLIEGSFTPNPPPPALPPAERVLTVPLEARVYAVKG
jgi:hypothetical protein